MTKLSANDGGEVLIDMAQRGIAVKHIYIKNNEVFHEDVFHSIEESLARGRPQINEYITFEFERYKELKLSKDAGFWKHFTHASNANKLKQDTLELIVRYYKVIQVLNSGNHKEVRFYIQEVPENEFLKLIS